MKNKLSPPEVPGQAVVSQLVEERMGRQGSLIYDVAGSNPAHCVNVETLLEHINIEVRKERVT